MAGAINDKYKFDMLDIENIMELYVLRYMKQLDKLPATFENICRICFKELDDGCFVDLNSTVSQYWNHTIQSFAEMVWKVTGRVLAGDDGLPANICKHCAKDIIKSYCLLRKIDYTQRVIDTFGKRTDSAATETSNTDDSGGTNTACGVSLEIIQNIKHGNSFSENDIIDMDAVWSKALPIHQHTKSETDNLAVACQSCLKFIGDDRVQLERYYMAEKQRILDISKNCEKTLAKSIESAIESVIGEIGVTTKTSTTTTTTTDEKHTEKAVGMDKSEEAVAAAQAAKNVSETIEDKTLSEKTIDAEANKNSKFWSWCKLFRNSSSSNH